ncbi:hypothetical protein BLNAU_14537 [Blattamonas nauphoetae]|uniref:Uncharacterized protein n=1 Tax=Blattamonas nauphoetae TaxID=2049346 RepID=A0ABQ9XDI1_9EUKA|nr:hypothetical protein BLNAU_14537 [Blattamonas nauphoetae]
MTQFVLTSPVAYAYIDNGLRDWKRNDRVDQERGKQILTQLREEGLSDGLELSLQKDALDAGLAFEDELETTFVCELGTDFVCKLGGNAI